MDDQSRPVSKTTIQLLMSFERKKMEKNCFFFFRFLFFVSPETYLESGERAQVGTVLDANIGRACTAG